MRIVFFTALVLLALPASAQTGDEARYSACMQTALSDPATAFEEAVTWEGLGGGHAARHCAQAALIGLGHYSEAAQGLERLADEVRAGARFKAELLVQAGNAWILADDPKRALAVFDAAASIATLPADIQIDRARAFAALGAYWEAIDALDVALASTPRDPNLLAMQASAYIHVEAFDLALEAANRALSEEPLHADALLAHGNALRLLGRKAQARKSWLKLIEALPDSEQAAQAQGNLQRMELSAD